MNTNLTFVGFIDTDGDGVFTAANGDEVVPQLFSENGTIRFTPSVSGELFIVFVDQDYSDNQGDLNFGVNFTVERDSDNDGIFDHLDIDSDNDGITDNVEAQATDAYIAPLEDNPSTATINEADNDNDGLNDAYDDNLGGAAGSVGLIPVDSDGNTVENLPDYIDLDSDDDELSDAEEAGHGQPIQTGLSDANTDTDGDGLFNDVDEVDGTTNGWDANDEDVTTAAGQTVADKSEFNLTDTPELRDDLSNVNINRSNIDLAFRDTNLDTDSDGINDDIDIDDDNDGIVDFDEGTTSINLLPNRNPTLTGTGNNRVWTYNSITTVDGITYNLQVSQVGARNIGGVTLTSNGSVNITNWNPRSNPYIILEYALIDQTTGEPVVFDAFRFQQNDIDGQRFGATNNLQNQSEAFELLGYQTGEPEAVTFNTNQVRTSGFRTNSTPAGFTTLRQNSTNPSNVTNGTHNVGFEYENTSSFQLLYGLTSTNTTTDNSVSRNFLFGSFNGIFFSDTGGDGVQDVFDLDSDNDGITDNVEAQSTANYIAPSGSVADGTFIDANNDGLDDVYDSAQTNVIGTNADGTYTHVGTGLTPVNTDGLNDGQDFHDIDSDEDGIIDAAERGTAGPTTDHSNVIADATTDADGDGLLDVFKLANGIVPVSGVATSLNVSSAILYLMPSRSTYRVAENSKA